MKRIAPFEHISIAGRCRQQRIKHILLVARVVSSSQRLINMNPINKACISFMIYRSRKMHQ